jgi:ketosteroid isomerase-like protein
VQVLPGFLAAIDNLDWPAFRSYFASNVTMFHPGFPNIKRIDSPEDFEKAWLGVFSRIKKESGRSEPPYMSLQPEDLRIETLCPTVALATFHLFQSGIVSRRSIVFRQASDGWKIVHIHASNIASSAT